MIVKALALDPGVTTGYCHATIEGQDVLIEPKEDRLSPQQFHALVTSVLDQYTYETEVAIIYEDFQFRQGVRTGLDLTPAKLIGIIELLEEDIGSVIRFYRQQPSVQGEKAFFSNERLKEMGVYWPHGKGHARSATKHLLYWLKFSAGAQYVRDPVFKIKE